eukprot:3356569-Pleurochrysis_carterae.AAC.1
MRVKLRRLLRVKQTLATQLEAFVKAGGEVQVRTHARERARAHAHTHLVSTPPRTLPFSLARSSFACVSPQAQRHAHAHTHALKRMHNRSFKHARSCISKRTNTHARELTRARELRIAPELSVLWDEGRCGDCSVLHTFRCNTCGLNLMRAHHAAA